MVVKICDRCGKQYYPSSPLSQAKLFSYNITVVEGFPLNCRNVDLCDECQRDFDKWMKEKKLDNGEAERRTRGNECAD